MYPEYLQQYIPTGFKLENYKASVKLDLLEWILNLNARITAYAAATISGHVLDKKQKHILEELIDKTISLGVLVPSPEEKKNIEKFYDEFFIQRSAIIKDLDFYDLLKLSETLLSDEKKKIYSKIDPLLYDLKPKHKDDILEQPIRSALDDNDPYCWLRVDLSCSKKEIYDAFGVWLAQTKKSYDASNTPSKSTYRKITQFNETTYKKWYAAKVLPYIDLVTWNYLQGNEINDKIISEILYIDNKHPDFEGINYLRLTTRPHVKKLMDIDTLRRMASVHSNNRYKNNS